MAIPVRNFKDLIVWQRAMELVETVYRTTEAFPRREIFGLKNQMRRAAVSIPSNIAEGQARDTTRDFLHFLCVAHGSLQELETQIRIAGRLQYLDAASISKSLNWHWRSPESYAASAPHWQTNDIKLIVVVRGDSASWC